MVFVYRLEGNPHYAKAFDTDLIGKLIPGIQFIAGLDSNLF
jgi:hypothetical protein